MTGSGTPPQSTTATIAFSLCSRTAQLPANSAGEAIRPRKPATIRRPAIRRDERDEYIYVDLGSEAPGRVDGQAISGKPLRTGDRIELGDWTLSYFREEFADHGIPFGGQHGSDADPVQQEPRPRGTSPEGGSDRTADDPGEYF